MLSVQWALGPWNGIVYLVLAATIVVIEYMVRGVYFKYEESPKRRLWLMLLWVLVWGGSVVLNIRLSTPFIEYEQLTMHGSNRIVLTLVTLVGVCGVVRAAVDIHRKRNKKDL